MSNWKLKILTGEHAGSELDLVVGNYLCGSDDNDDLIFQEPGLFSQHFLLKIENQQISLILQRPDSCIRVNGQISATTELVLEEVIPVAIDDFQFAVANGPAEWPQPITPEAHSNREQGENAEGCEIDAGDAGDAGIETRSTPLPGLGWTETFNRMKVGLGIAGACAGLLLMLTVGSMSNAEKTQSNTVNDTATTQQSLVNEIVQQLALPNVTVVPMADGSSWLLEGYVDDISELNRLNLWVEAKKMQTTNKVKVIDELSKGAEIALTALGYSNVSVSKSDKPGYLVLTGNVDDDASWKKNRGRLQVDVPGVIGFEDRVTADTKMALAPLPDLVVKGIYMGKAPFFVLGNGEKYFVGSQLKYGYRVEDISPQMLQLRRGDKLIQYRLGAD